MYNSTKARLLLLLFEFKGISHLASTRIVGGNSYPKRTPYYESYDGAKVRNDVNLLSYYCKNRDAAKHMADDDAGKEFVCFF